MYEKEDGVDMALHIYSPWLKLNCYGIGRNPDCPRLKIGLSLESDEEKQFYNLLSSIDKIFDKDEAYRPIIKKDYLDSRPDYLVIPFIYNYNGIGKKMISSFFFNNNNVITKIEVETIDDQVEYFQLGCHFRYIMSFKSFRKNNVYNYKYNFISICLDLIEVKSERTELNSIRIRREALLINLANLHTLPLKGVINVKLSSDIFLIDDNPEYPDKPSAECPISKEDFVNNEDVIIFNRAKHGFKHMYKLTSLQAWIIHTQPTSTDPTTREPITKQNVERYKLQFM